MRTCLNDIDIHYIIEGAENPADRTIVLLHGWGANVKLYSQLISHLAQKNRVYALDLPGFGESAEPSRPFSVDDFADFVVDFIRFLGITETTLIGHSHGGRISIKLASRKNLPFTLQRMVFLDAAGILPKKTFRQKLRGRTYKVARTVLSTGFCKALYPDALENLRQKHGSADYLNASPLMRQTMVKVVNEDLEPLLPSISVSTLLIWGEKDTATPLSDGKTMERLIPDAGLVVIPGAGHFAYLENFPMVQKVLDAFLR